MPCEPLSTRISGVNRVFLGQDYGVAVLAWPRRSVCTVSGLSPGLLAKSRRYWAVLQKGCPEARVNRAFQRWVPGSPLSTRVSEHMPGDALSTRGSEAPLGKAFGNARQRFLCLSRIHLTFATALLRLAVLLVLFAACRLVSKINSIRYTTSGRLFTRRCGSYPAVGCLSQPTPIKFRPRQSGASRLAGWRRTNWSCQRRPSPPSCRNAPSA